MEKPTVKKYNKSIIVSLILFVILVSLYPYAKNSFEKTMMIVYAWSILVVGAISLILVVRSVLLAIKETHDELDNHTLNRD